MTGGVFPLCKCEGLRRVNTKPDGEIAPHDVIDLEERNAVVGEPADRPRNQRKSFTEQIILQTRHHLSALRAIPLLFAFAFAITITHICC